MKYKKTQTQIIEDTELFKTMSAYKMAKITGIDQGRLSKIKNGHLIPTEKWYLSFKKKLGLGT